MPCVLHLLWIIAALGGVTFLYWRAQQQIKSRFLGRPVLSFEVWFETFYTNPSIDRDAVVMILTLIARDIGIHPTQLHPSDSFSRDICYRKWYLLNDSMEVAMEELRLYLRTRIDQEWRPSLKNDNLGDFIEDVNKFVRTRTRTDGGAEKTAMLSLGIDHGDGSTASNRNAWQSGERKDCHDGIGQAKGDKSCVRKSLGKEDEM